MKEFTEKRKEFQQRLAKSLELRIDVLSKLVATGAPARIVVNAFFLLDGAIRATHEDAYYAIRDAMEKEQHNIYMGLCPKCGEPVEEPFHSDMAMCGECQEMDAEARSLISEDVDHLLKEMEDGEH